MDLTKSSAVDPVRLRRYRRQLRLTRAALAARTGVSASAIEKWERGSRALRDPLWIAGLAQELGVPVGALFAPVADHRHAPTGPSRAYLLAVSENAAQLARLKSAQLELPAELPGGS